MTSPSPSPSTAPATPPPVAPRTAAEQVKLGFNHDFHQRLIVLGVRQAMAVLDLPVDSPRMADASAFSVDFLASPVAITSTRLAWAVVADLATSESASDAELAARVAAVWPALSARQA